MENKTYSIGSALSLEAFNAQQEAVKAASQTATGDIMPHGDAFFAAEAKKVQADIDAGTNLRAGKPLDLG